MKIDNAVVLVTGAKRGIGLAWLAAYAPTRTSWRGCATARR